KRIQRFNALSSISAVALSAVFLAAGSHSAFAVSCATGISSTSTNVVTGVNQMATVTGNPTGFGTPTSVLTDVTFTSPAFGLSSDSLLAANSGLSLDPLIFLNNNGTVGAFTQVPDGVSVVQSVNTVTNGAIATVAPQYSGANDGSGVGNPQTNATNTACGTN